MRFRPSKFSEFSKYAEKASHDESKQFVANVSWRHLSEPTDLDRAIDLQWSVDCDVVEIEKVLLHPLVERMCSGGKAN